MARSIVEKVIAIATTVFVILLGIAFIVCTAHLYFTGGEDPYSRERVGGYLLTLLPLSIITIGHVIAGIVVKIIRTRNDDELSSRTHSELLESFSSRYAPDAFGGEAGVIIAKERSNRKIFKYIAYAFSALIFVLVLVYICFFAEFTVDNLNADVVAAFVVALPLCVIAVGIHVPRIYLAESSCKRELEAMKFYIKENGVPTTVKKDKPTKKFDYMIIAKVGVACIAIAFIILGVVNGGMKDVLAKAVKICTECIGLG